MNTAAARLAPRQRPRLLLVALLLLLLVVTSAWPLGRILRSETVTVPSVLGLNAQAANTVLQREGLRVELRVERHRDVEPDRVVSQSPRPGLSVRPGRTVVLGVNRAPEALLTPAVDGLRERDAIHRIEAMGLVVAEVRYVNAERPVGTVVAQLPNAGASVQPGARVTLSVSRGSVDTPFALPNLVGQPIEVAEATLAALGVRHIERVAAAVSVDQPGRVTDQRPRAGSEVRAGTVVSLVYAVQGTQVVMVPALAGLPLWRAELALTQAGLQLGAVRTIDDAGLPAGVIETWPGGYTLLGSPIGVVFNRAGGTAEERGPLGFPLPGSALGIPVPPPSLPATGVAGQPAAAPATAAPTPATATPAPAVGDAPEPAVGDAPEPAVGDAPESEAEPPVEAVFVPPPGARLPAEEGGVIVPFRFEPVSVGIPSLMRAPYLLRLVVIDAEGERVVFEQVMGAGEGVAIPVRVVGDTPLLELFLNDLFYEAWRP